MPLLSENNVIRQIARAVRDTRAGRRGMVLGIGDDAALWQPSRGQETILTCDWFLEGTHFLRDKHPPDSIGWKCLARALSDVAAMGGVPRCFLLGLALPLSCSGRWLSEFLRGLGRAAQRFDCVLAGGDTTTNRKILISVTVVGETASEKALRRIGARPGDLLFVTGRLGEAELGLRLLRQHHGQVNRGDPVLKKHLYPDPRLAIGQWLAREQLASAMMDISDGLSTDLARLCAVSGVGARIYAAQLPVPSLPARWNASRGTLLDLALHGGDDYELLFTVPRRNLKRVSRSLEGITLSPIGEVTRAKSLLLVDAAGRERRLTSGGWDPFRSRRIA